MIPASSAMEHPHWHLLDHFVADLLLDVYALCERLGLALLMALLDRDVLTVVNLDQFAVDDVTVLLADLLLPGVTVALLMAHLLVLGLTDRPKQDRESVRYLRLAEIGDC